MNRREALKLLPLLPFVRLPVPTKLPKTLNFVVYERLGMCYYNPKALEVAERILAPRSDT
jgi:hypothetical protein